MVLAGRHVGHTGNATLLLAKAADANGVVSTNAASAGAQWALQQGARVLNFSVGPMYRHYGASTDAWYSLAVQRDAVAVLVAGNESWNLTTQAASYTDIFEPAYQAYRDVSLVVGALNGTQLASYSNYPGESAALRSRFLVAAGIQPVQARDATEPASSAADLSRFSGTSVATPVVAAAAATLRAYWPHLSANATTQLLLDTASRSFSALYNLNTCGSSGQVNCGYYTFGQGRLDLDRALQPVGPASVPAGTQLAGASYALDQTQLVLPAAFGDALAGRQLNAALFDSYGRDFGFNLLQRVSVGAGASLLQAAQAETPLRFASLAGGGPLARYDRLHAVDGLVRLDAVASLRWRGTHARAASGGTAAPTATAVRQDAGLQWRVGEGGRIGAGVAFTQERHALLGGSGSAGLGIQDAWQHALVLEGDMPLAGGLSVFGRAEWGRLMARGNGLLTRLDGGRTTQWDAGLAWARVRERWGLALSQPVRVDQARAHFNLPVGRTLDGTVLRETARVDLAPGGRQINLELAYQHQPDAFTQWGFNAAWVRDHGHVRGQREWALMARYQKRW